MWAYILAAFIVWLIVKRIFLEKLYIDYEGKYVFVTGCDSGFGKLTVLDLLSKNVNVFAGCFTEKGEEELHKRAREISGGGKVYTTRLDITKDESVERAFNYVRRILSENNSCLWALLNNAGVFSIFGPDDWCSVDEYKNALDVNTLGAIRVTHKFLPLLKHSRGRVVTMGSSAGRIHGRYVGPYVTAKFALEAYMDCLRLEMREFGVSVHIQEPGAFKTDLLNDDALNSRVDNIWERLSEQVRFEYGETFKENFKLAWHTGVAIVANPNLMWVVNNNIHAMFSRFPRCRYYTGYDAIFCFIPMSLLPTFWQDNILHLMYSLQPGPTLVPECLKTKMTVDENMNKCNE